MGRHPHLRQRHRTWYARIAVPADLRGYYGDRTTIDESMKTDSLSDAQIRRDLFLAKYRAEFKARRQNQNLTEDDFARLRAVLAHKAHTEMAATPWQDDIEIDKRVLATFNSDAVQQDKDIAALLTKEGYAPTPANVRRLVSVLYEAEQGAANDYRAGRPPKSPAGVVPLSRHIDTWLSESNIQPRQKLDYRRAVTKLGDWLTSNHHATIVHEITKVVAGLYISNLLAQKMNLRTLKKEKSALSSYWTWLDAKCKVTGFGRRPVDFVGDALVGARSGIPIKLMMPLKRAT